MTTILVANRGEIAIRVFNTAKRMGLRCVAVFSDADDGATFVRAADEAINIGPAPASESYLRIDRIIDAAKQSGASLIHPGYGFLSESAEFAEACEAAGLTFVGPPPAVLRAMGAKDEAKKIAAEAGVPVLSGYSGPDQSDDAFISALDHVGLPAIVKPVAGGGGKGMAVISSVDEAPGVLAAARRAGAASFGDDRLLIERYLTAPHHVEVQLIADAHGNVIHLGERDCSLQRRHQKIMEESPSPAIDNKARAVLCESAVALARAVGYRNAGTCEFLVDADGTIAFMEMNARLQVEHPVTEMVTGVDLVQMQIEVAMGEPLGLAQNEVTPSGHAIEVRLYAEDPSAGFIPQAGEVLHVTWPADARIDTAVDEGTVISTNYDPMIAKLIVRGDDRVSALAALAAALESTQILGVTTNLPFLRSVIADPVVAQGRITTNWLGSGHDWEVQPPEVPAQALALAAAAALSSSLHSTRSSADPWATMGPRRLGGAADVPVVVVAGGEESVIEVAGTGPFTSGGHVASRSDGCHAWTIDSEPASVVMSGDDCFVWFKGWPFEIAIGAKPRREEAAGAAHLGSPMPGQVLAVKVAAGDSVKKGQELVVVEAMKMEHSVRAPFDGVVAAVLCAPGDQVAKGRALVDVTTE